VAEGCMLSRRQRKRLLYLSQLMDVVEPWAEYLPVCATPARIVRHATYREEPNDGTK